MGMTLRDKGRVLIEGSVQLWHTQGKRNMPKGACPISWEVFKKEFQRRFFPRDKREEKVEEFINLHH